MNNSAHGTGTDSHACREAAGARSLRGVIGPAGFFTLAFGSIVGSGWVLVLGDWLRSAGPGGAILGFALGGTVMLLVAICYAELASRIPRTGGEFVYALQGLGAKYAFAVSWFLTLYFAAFTAFEGIAFAWLMATLFPGAMGPVLYSLLGEDVTAGALAFGLAGAALFAAINYAGTSLAIGFQRIVTFGFLALAAALIATALLLGDPGNARPFFASASDRSWVHGAFWIFATTAVFLNGFQVALYAVEERKPQTSIHGVIVPMIFGVLAAVAFYCFIILAASFSAPWREFIAAELPTAAAFGRLTDDGLLAKVVLIGAAISLLKSWNAYVLSAARLLFAQARERFLPSGLGRIHPARGTPAAAIIVVFALNVIGVLLGRGAIVPIVNMCAICLACSFVLCLSVLLKVRARGGTYEGFRVPGSTWTILLALAGVTLMAATAIVEPKLRSPDAIPLEWILMAAWGTLGMASWVGTRSLRREH